MAAPGRRKIHSGSACSLPCNGIQKTGRKQMRVEVANKQQEKGDASAMVLIREIARSHTMPLSFSTMTCN